MKLMKFFFALSLLSLIVSCSKEEANIPNDEYSTSEVETYKLILPEGVTLENAAEWFNQLPEERIEDYVINDSDTAPTANTEANARSCGTWSSWSGWLIISTNFSCFSRACPNPQSQESVLKRRSRVRQCTGGAEVQTQTSFTRTCYPPC